MLFAFLSSLNFDVLWQDQSILTWLATPATFFSCIVLHDIFFRCAISIQHLQQQLSSSCNFQRIIGKFETFWEPSTLHSAESPTPQKSSALWFVSLSVAVADCSPVWQLLCKRQGMVCTWMSRFASVLQSQECLALPDVWYQGVLAIPKFGIFWVSDVSPCGILHLRETFANLEQVWTGGLMWQPDQACMSELDAVLPKQLSLHWCCSKSLSILRIPRIGERWTRINKEHRNRRSATCFCQAFRHV